MKASQFFIRTLKEAPADAEIVSHKLMMRAGLIRKLGAGIYNYMPMGLKVIRKVEGIIREELDKAGAVGIIARPHDAPPHAALRPVFIGRVRRAHEDQRGLHPHRRLRLRMRHGQRRRKLSHPGHG